MEIENKNSFKKLYIEKFWHCLYKGATLIFEQLTIRNSVAVSRGNEKLQRTCWKEQNHSPCLESVDKTKAGFICLVLYAGFICFQISSLKLVHLYKKMTHSTDVLILMAKGSRLAGVLCPEDKRKSKLSFINS